MTKSLVKILTLALSLGLIPAHMMAMEDDPQNALIQYIDDNARDILGNTILDLPIALEDALGQMAQLAIEGNSESLRKLLAANCNANQVFYSVMHWLGRQEDLSIEQKEAFAAKLMPLLLEHEFDINAEGGDGRYSPLVVAIFQARLPRLAQFLIQEGADVNTRNHFGGYPILSLAISYATIELVKCIIDHGADINAADIHGHTCLETALFNPTSGIAELLIQLGAHVNNESLPIAIMSDSLELCKLILNKGINPNIIIEEISLLDTVLFKQYAKQLIRINAEMNGIGNVDGLDQFGKNDLAYMQLLFDYGANNIDLQDEHGSTVLMLAAGLVPAKVQEQINAMVAAGAQITLEDICKEVNFLPFARLLLDHGANRELQNHAGQTALDIAIECGNIEMIELLENYHPWGQAELQLRAARAFLAHCAALPAEEVQNLFNAIGSEHLRNAVMLIAPKAIKDKIADVNGAQNNNNPSI